MKFNIDNYSVGKNPTILTLVCEGDFERKALTHLFDRSEGEVKITTCREGDHRDGVIDKVIIYKVKRKK